jgi:hypothetical protein
MKNILFVAGIDFALTETQLKEYSLVTELSIQQKSLLIG